MTLYLRRRYAAAAGTICSAPGKRLLTGLDAGDTPERISAASRAQTSADLPPAATSAQLFPLPARRATSPTTILARTMLLARRWPTSTPAALQRADRA